MIERVSEKMSMGELLFWICERHDLDPLVHIVCDVKAKPLSVKGTVGQCKNRDDMHLMPIMRARRGTEVLPAAPTRVRKLDISGPQLITGPALVSTLTPLAETHRVEGFLSDGVGISDPRMPPLWRDVFLAGHLTDEVLFDSNSRAIIMSLIEKHGGPSAVLGLPQATIVDLFRGILSACKAVAMKNVGRGSMNALSSTRSSVGSEGDGSEYNTCCIT